jgi:hypothetical protein
MLTVAATNACAIGSACCSATRPIPCVLSVSANWSVMSRAMASLARTAGPANGLPPLPGEP